MSDGYREIVVRSGKEGKGRAFRAVVLAMATAPIWDKHEATDDKVRPALLVLGCEGQQAGPVLANLRMGNVATLTGDGVYHRGTALETLKSVRYSWSTQRVDLGDGQAGAVLTARLHSLVSLDPGIVEPDQHVQFMIAPPRGRLEEELLALPAADMRKYGETRMGAAFKKPAMDWQRADLQRDDDVWHFAPAMALWFCAMVDRRVSVPILPDPLFQMRFYLAALHHGLAGWSLAGRWGSREDTTWGRRGPVLREWGYAAAGLAPGVACSATQDAIRDLLVAEVRGWNEDLRRVRAYSTGTVRPRDKGQGRAAAR